MEASPEWVDLVIDVLYVIAILLISCGVYLATRKTGGLQVLDDPASAAKGYREALDILNGPMY